MERSGHRKSITLEYKQKVIYIMTTCRQTQKFSFQDVISLRSVFEHLMVGLITFVGA